MRLNGGQFVWRASPKFRAETFEWHLRQLLRHRRRGKRMPAVLDNADYHHDRQLRPLLHRVRHLLALLFFASYGLQRLATHNRHFATLWQRVTRRSLL